MSARRSAFTSMPAAVPIRVRVFAGTAGGVLLGGVLLLAALLKAIDPAAFGEQLVAEGLTFGMPAVPAVAAALGVEVAIGLALCLGLRRGPVLAAATALVAFFLVLTARLWWRSAHGLLDEAAASCGCFGNLVERTPAEAFWQDLLLLVPPLALCFVARPAGPWPRARLVALGLGTVAVVALAVLAPALPLDDLATRLGKGTELAATCAGEEPRVCVTDVLPELVEGMHWVVLVDLADPALHERVPRLNDHVLSGGGAPFWVVTSATPAELSTFVWENGPSFDLREAPRPLLRPLYRRLPRSFLVRDGVVEETVDGWPPWLEPPATGA